MATKCRRRKISKKKIANIAVYGTLASIMVTGATIGFVVGRVSAPTKETVVMETTSKEDKSTDTTLYYDVPLSHPLQKYIFEICEDEGVPVALVLAMIENESGFNPEAVSTTADTGLMQLNEINYGMLEEEYHCSDMLNPYQNVYCGIKMIASYLKKYEGDTHKALMAYNMGEYGATKAWEDGVTSTNYSARTIELMEKYMEEKHNGKNN